MFLNANWSSQLEIIVDSSRNNIGLTLWVLGILWGFHLLNFLIGYRLNSFGIWPRHLLGLPGILLAPLLHANQSHLAFNSIPLFVLINLMLLYGMPTFIGVSLFIGIVSGLCVWCFGRRAIHIGASGVVLGYWGFLLLLSYYQPGVMAIFIAVLCLYYLGSLAFNLFPLEKGSSWEGHVFGFLSGLLAAYLYFHGFFNRYLYPIYLELHVLEG